MWVYGQDFVRCVQWLTTLAEISGHRPGRLISQYCTSCSTQTTCARMNEMKRRRKSREILRTTVETTMREKGLKRDAQVSRIEVEASKMFYLSIPPFFTFSLIIHHPRSPGFSRVHSHLRMPSLAQWILSLCLIRIVQSSHYGRYSMCMHVPIRFPVHHPARNARPKPSLCPN